MEQEMTIDLVELFYMIKRRIKLIVWITVTLTLLSTMISVFVLTPKTNMN
ncbi:Wzz/FepE/Etk N-terminal domain-containing protein [Caloramator sp. mosi_1]|nr:Wzz/FepE/Etk N-terminal domain-containing protein [Caloramator sp. mosi_1]WDC84204.1 Wzz/FepE/Etk N-terminal domain-containing protein [Caloramator sp. mosi_1]